MTRQSTPQPFSTRFLGSLLTLLLALLAGAAAAAPPGDIAEVENQGSTLVFYPYVEYAELVLAVTGPCDYQYRKTFRVGETPFWRVDGQTIDGRYRIELSTVPEISGQIIEVLKEARKANNEEVPKALCRQGLLPGPPLDQTHVFLVDRGEIVFDPGSDDGKLGSSDDLGGAGLSGLGKAQGDPAAKDFFIGDDLIVDGSACIGFDCVNGESFGFDTIRLKENNLRIKFDDTSTAASFPRNDWQLTANDSANGGASKFSIDDITNSRTPFTVEANARSHSLYVDDGGRIGSRTSTPSTEIHTIDGDTPTLRLQQDGSSGFAPQTWDVAGNETNFFIRDVTNGSALPFRIRPGAPSSAIFIDVDGDVGMGDSSPDASLNVEASDGTAQILVEETSSTEATRDLIRIENNGTTRMAMEDTSADGEEWQFAVNGASNAFVITNQGSGFTEFTLVRANTGAANAGDLTIIGDIFTGGGTCGGGCDALFQSEVESIEDHAASMWENSYLPGVGPTSPDEPWNLTEKTSGILNELEKAHIYIEQLNDQLRDRDGEIADLKERLSRIEALLGAQPAD
jgi:hypothetical protein